MKWISWSMVDFPAIGGRIFGELKEIESYYIIADGGVFAHSSRPEANIFEPHMTGGKMCGSVAGMEDTADMNIMAVGAEGDDHVAPDRREMKTRRGRHRSR